MLMILMNTTPEFVSIPRGADIKRSCNGDIHLLPKRPRSVTEDEAEYIQTNYPQLAVSVMKSQPATHAKDETLSSGTDRQQDDVESESESEPVEDSETGIAETVDDLLEMSIPRITAELEAKNAMMDASDYEMLVRSLIAKENKKPEPRSTLVERLEVELE